MRLWSIHPKYLDSIGLIALWREALLAKKVLEGKTKGYKNHPQLERFKNSENPLNCINFYLKTIAEEAKHRNYNFDESKIEKYLNPCKIRITRGQIEFEKIHLLKKLQKRNVLLYEKFMKIDIFEVNPIFEIIPGVIEHWEKT
jgi:hypothetical protein